MALWCYICVCCCVVVDYFETALSIALHCFLDFEVSMRFVGRVKRLSFSLVFEWL